MTRSRLFAGWVILLLSSPCLIAAAALSSLTDAVKQQDASAMQKLLTEGADVNAASPDGTTALHWAARLRDLTAAELLVKAGANVKAANRYGVTPLSLACINGDAATVELLLQAGADPNTTLPEGETALMTAARTGNLKAVNTLLAHGAEVNKTEGWRSQTALMWASGEGHADVVERLIEQGADVHAKSETGFTAFLFAVREGRIDAARALLKAGATVSESLPPRLKRSTGAGEYSSEGVYSSLQLAISNGPFELAAMLLDAGADPNADEQGWKPLHAIAWIRKPGGGANELGPIGSGNMDSLELVRKLVEHGADVNAQMTKRGKAGAIAIGATPFMVACKTADANLMRLLVELGADPLMPNKDNTTPLMAAAGVGTRSPGEDAGTEEEVLEAVKLALELGNDINAVDDQGETAMHGAAYKHLPSVVEYLAANGADIEIWNRKNETGWTPLRIAAGVRRGGNIRITEPTEAKLREIMKAAGASTELEPDPTRGGSAYSSSGR